MDGFGGLAVIETRPEKGLLGDEQQPVQQMIGYVACRPVVYCPHSTFECRMMLE